MQLRRYWAKAAGFRVDAQGWRVDTAAYAGSDESQADAQARAAQELARRLAWIEAPSTRPSPFDGYPPLTRPIREAVLWRQDGPDGRPTAALTRSNNGYLVLNTTALMIVDVDHLPRPGAAGRVRSAVKGVWARLRGEAPDAEALTDPVALALRPFLAAHPDWGLRVYRTFAGYRYLVTHAPVDARDPASLDVLRRLHADPVYRQLCRRQECYRARLTPKTHRVRCPRPGQAFPYATEAELHAQREWERQYEHIIQGYATVELLGQYGAPGLHPDLRALIELHDGHALKPGRPLA